MSEVQSPEPGSRWRRMGELKDRRKLSAPLPFMEDLDQVLETQQGMKYVLGSPSILSLVVDRCRI